MKSIVAIVHHDNLEPLQCKLESLGIEELGVSPVLVRRKGPGRTLIYRSATIRVPYEPRMRLELIVEDHQADAVVAAIVKTGFVGEIDPVGAGKIRVRPCHGSIPTGRA